ncbi:MAG: thioredoxin-disulfide reductase [Bacteroidota bacterium]
MRKKIEHTVIIGGGAAGYTAAIYTARAGLHPILYQGPEPGGQLTTTTDVENYPGYPKGVLGPKMMEDFKEQAIRFGTDVRTGVITSLNTTKEGYQLQVDNGDTLLTETVIIATGATAKWLGLPSEERLKGRGVSSCAVCDGFFFKGQTVAVVGGGDSAAEEATYLAKLCKKVHLFVRKGAMRASHIMQQRVLKTDNITVHYHTETVEIVGEKEVEGVRIINNQTKKTTQHPIQGFFVAIGHQPNTQIFPQIEKDELGYIITKAGTTQTNIPGIFAAGDVQDRLYRQAITAAGTGCMAALEAERYLANKKSN